MDCFHHRSILHSRMRLESSANRDPANPQFSERVHLNVFSESLQFHRPTYCSLASPFPIKSTFSWSHIEQDQKTFANLIGSIVSDDLTDRLFFSNSRLSEFTVLPIYVSLAILILLSACSFGMCCLTVTIYFAIHLSAQCQIYHHAASLRSGVGYRLLSHSGPCSDFSLSSSQYDASEAWRSRILFTHAKLEDDIIC